MWADLPADVLEELQDERFKSRTHHKKATYAVGCRGPLCKKEERDLARAETEANAIAAGRTYNPVPTTAQERDDELNRIKLWHFSLSNRSNKVPA